MHGKAPVAACPEELATSAGQRLSFASEVPSKLFPRRRLTWLEIHLLVSCVCDFGPHVGHFVCLCPPNSDVAVSPSVVLVMAAAVEFEKTVHCRSDSCVLRSFKCLGLCSHVMPYDGENRVLTAHGGVITSDVWSHGRRFGQRDRAMGGRGELGERGRGGGARPSLGTVSFLCLSFVVEIFFRGRRVEGRERPNTTALAGRGQEEGIHV